MSIVLTIAGTDPSGAAGIQADLQVIRDHGHHGVSVITAVLAQNTVGVRDVYPMSVDQVSAQLDAVFEDFDVAAVKVGLVPTDELVELISARVGHLRVVWDPVITSGDGATELFGGSTAALLAAFERVDVCTPNIPEIAQLTNRPILDRDAARDAARDLARTTPAVLLKTGHLLHGAAIRDIWAHGDVLLDLEPLPAVDADVRGTGCQLSTAVACGLADGRAPLDAVDAARRYLNVLLREQAHPVGRGRRIVVRP